MIYASRLMARSTARLRRPAANFSVATELTEKMPARKSDPQLLNYRYVDGELVPVSNLVLKQKESIEDYVLKIVGNYYRTNNRVNLTVDSALSDHGLDSLDSIELAMQIEEDLGYRISSENLSLFAKVKHYVTFIEQVENFKAAYGKNPLP